jgi:hypothetical protein
MASLIQPGRESRLYTGSGDRCQGAVTPTEPRTTCTGTAGWCAKLSCRVQAKADGAEVKAPHA